MNTEESFIRVLTTSNFGVTSRNAIVEFCCDTLLELARLPSKELDKSIGNLHKSLSNTVLLRRVRLNATKCIILHAIRTHFKDRINCDAQLTADDILALV